MEAKYLINNPEREHEILRNFHKFLDKISNFLITLNIAPHYSWYLIEFPIEQLVSSVSGEVDILVGKLDPADPEKYKNSLERFKKLNSKMHPSVVERLAANDLAWNGGLKWIPSLDYLVGIEVKCCYLPKNASEISEDEIKSKKNFKSHIKGIQKQVNKLLNIGFNKVGLFEFIANPPADGVGSRPWFIASAISSMSANAMNNIFNDRLPEDSPVGHGICSFSGILGKEEHGNGAYSFPVLRQAQENFLLTQEKVKANRLIMEQNLSRILQEIPQPRNMPAIFVYDYKTRKLCFVNEGIFSV